MSGAVKKKGSNTVFKLIGIALLTPVALATPVEGPAAPIGVAAGVTAAALVMSLFGGKK